MRLTKTDFIHYLNCPHSLWLQKHEPESFPQGEVSAFLLKLAQDGSLAHHEYLAHEAVLPIGLIESLRAHIGDKGHLVSWHASFEATRNREMAARYLEHAAFLNELNDRTVDLEDLFKTAYVDAAFDGYTSIKKVLPVLCPDLSYCELAIQNGTGAMEAWARLVDPVTPFEEHQQISENLRRYCALDTFAMVEIFRAMQKQVLRTTVRGA